MSIWPILLILVTAPVTSSQPGDTPGAPASDHARVATLVVQVDGMAFAEIRQAVRMRAPALSVRSARDPDFTPPKEALFAYAIVHRSGDVRQEQGWSVTLIFSDGRAFFRTVDTDEHSAARVVATTLSNLLIAAEAGRIDADAIRDVPVPPREPPRESSGTVETPAPAPPVPELGVGIAGAVVAGFGPPRDTDNLLGGAGGLELALRLPAGAVLSIGARPASRTRLGHRLVRVQTSIAAGYVWRRGRFELATLGALTIEPWWLLASGDLENVIPTQTNDDFSPFLLGGLARISPGYRVGIGRGHSLHLGARLDFGASGMPRGGIGRLTVSTADGTLRPLYRLGGLELAAGLELVFWFRTARADAPRTTGRRGPPTPETTL